MADAVSAHPAAGGERRAISGPGRIKQQQALLGGPTPSREIGSPCTQNISTTPARYENARIEKATVNPKNSISTPVTMAQTGAEMKPMK